MRWDVKFMEERAFRKSREMPSETRSEDDPLVQSLQPAERSTSASPRHKNLEVLREEDSQEEEHVYPPTTSGRTSRELQQILRDAEEFVGAPRNEKRQRRKPDIYQALVAQVG